MNNGLDIKNKKIAEVLEKPYPVAISFDTPLERLSSQSPARMARLQQDDSGDYHIVHKVRCDPGLRFMNKPPSLLVITIFPMRDPDFY